MLLYNHITLLDQRLLVIGVLGQALRRARVKIKSALPPHLRAMRREERRTNSLSLVRPLEPVLARKLVNLLGSTRSVRVFLRLGRLAVFTVDPVEERGEDLHEGEI
jgi:hypothetical protein